MRVIIASMDIVSHGLYGGAAFVNKSKRSFLTAVWWGVFPDLIAFGTFFPIFIFRYGFHHERLAQLEPPAPELIPHYVHTIYNFSHSLIFFALAFGLVWFFLKRPAYEMLAWGLHIIMDIPSHTSIFFPTPFLYPFSSFTVNGISWGTPWFFFAYWGVLLVIYSILLLQRKKQILQKI